jgi:uncharacterized protein
MSDPALLDTNVLLRHILHDHADHSPRATALMGAVEHGDLRVRITETIVFEAVFTLEKFYKVPRTEIRDNLLPLIQLPGIELSGKRLYDSVFELYIAHRSLSFADSYHLCLASQYQLAGIITFEKKMDRFPGVKIWPPPVLSGTDQDD